MMRRRALTLLSLLLLGLSTAVAQQLVWSVDFNSLFNNREGGDEARPDQTFIFTRISPELGVMLGSDSSNVHLLKGGVTWFQPLNDNLDGYKVLPVMYYQYRHAGAVDCWRVTVGQLPRTQLMERAPRYLWSDSVAYHQPNVRGALVQYERGASYAELYLDWRQMQSVSRREAFNVVVDGKWSLWNRCGRCLWLGGYFQYNHLAKRKNAPEGEGVNDDVTINPMLGLDMDHWSVPVHFKAGAVVNRERARVEGKWHTPCGFVAGVNARWRFLEAEENVWAGQDLFPLYPRFGSQLNLGDTYYRDKFYSRTDLTAHIVQNDFVDLNTSFTFHYTNKTTGFWQQLSCRLYIDNLLWGHRRSRQRRLTSTY